MSGRYILLLGLLISSTEMMAEPLWYGLELGEIPIKGSRKFGLSFGYNNWSVSWQRADTIQRDDASFNAESLGWDGLIGSSESVGARSQLLKSWPLWRVKQGSAFWVPYLTTGWVWNGNDTERLRFDGREHDAAGGTLKGPVTVQIRRPSGHGLAVGAGFLWQWASSGQIYCHWTGALLSESPIPDVRAQGRHLTSEQAQWIQQRIRRDFSQRITNRYHLFSLGVRFSF